MVTARPKTPKPREAPSTPDPLPSGVTPVPITPRFPAPLTPTPPSLLGLNPTTPTPPPPNEAPGGPSLCPSTPMWPWLNPRMPWADSPPPGTMLSTISAASSAPAGAVNGMSPDNLVGPKPPALLIAPRWSASASTPPSCPAFAVPRGSSSAPTAPAAATVPRPSSSRRLRPCVAAPPTGGSTIVPAGSSSRAAFVLTNSRGRRIAHPHLVGSLPCVVRWHASMRTQC